jgi:hypothetical protein
MWTGLVWFGVESDGVLCLISPKFSAKGNYSGARSPKLITIFFVGFSYVYFIPL